MIMRNDFFEGYLIPLTDLFGGAYDFTKGVADIVNKGINNAVADLNHPNERGAELIKWKNIGHGYILTIPYKDATVKVNDRNKTLSYTYEGKRKGEGYYETFKRSETIAFPSGVALDTVKAKRHENSISVYVGNVRPAEKEENCSRTIKIED